MTAQQPPREPPGQPNQPKRNKRRPPTRDQRPPARATPTPRPPDADEEIVLAVLPNEPYDTTLDQPAPPVAPPVSLTPPALDERLVLPEGAWLAVRKSGGLLFRSRELVLYPDGRAVSVTIGGGQPARMGPPDTLPLQQLTALRRALAQLDFSQLPAGPVRQRPDAYVYELAVRVGRAVHELEVSEGSIPPPLAPLLRQLNQLLARED